VTPLLLTLLTACGPKDAAIEAAVPASALDQGPPAVADPGAWTPPAATVRTLDNGIQLWVLERHDLPLVSLDVVIGGGKAADPADRPGLVAIADDMLLRGAGDLDAQAFAAATDQLAWHFSVGTGDTDSTVTLSGHAARLDPALDLLASALLQPTFDDEELARLVDERQGDLANATSDPGTIAAWANDRAWYGDGHPLAHPAQGTPDALGAITAADARASWEARRSGGTPTIVAVGDVDADSLAAGLEQRLSAWSFNAADTALPARSPIDGGPRLTLVDNPGSSQSMLMLSLPAPALDDDDAPAARLGAIVLGGTFTSRLNRKLREEKGYTYGARARLDADPGRGRILVSTAVQRDVTGPALTDLLAELSRVHDDLSDEEVAKARVARRGDFVDLAQSRDALAQGYAGLAADGRAATSFADELTANDAVTAATALAALDASRLPGASVVVVGDLDVIRPAVQEALPGEWQERDVWGAPVE